MLAVLAVLGAAPGVVHASWMVPPQPFTAKDFTMAKRNGVYHLFYIRNNPTLAFPQTQKDLGHATSDDLYFWTHHPPVLPVRPGHFDNSHVWAPSIVERDGVYYMFYTGVRDSIGFNTMDQRSGLATSTDLYTWNRLDLPVLDCGDVPWSVCDSTASSPFRDPFVMADPTTPGRWLQYYTGSLASDPVGMIIGVAGSNGDFTSWQDLGTLDITSRFVTFSDVAESAHLFERAGVWYLFWTTNAGQPLSFATGPDPLAPAQAWTYRGRLSNMLGYNTAGWYASEYFRDGLVDYFLFVNGDRVEIMRMVWLPLDRFRLQQPDLFHVKTLTWMNASVRVGQEASLYIQSKWGTGRGAAVETFWLDDADVWHPVANGLLGIPDEIPLGGDLTVYSWLARALPDSLGAPEAPRIVVRMLDQTATSNLLQILPQVGGPGSEPPPDPVAGDPAGVGQEELAALPVQPRLRALKQGVFGSLPSLLVDLAEEVPARLDVFDLQGRRVRTLADRRLPAGASVVAWDGRDEAGRRLGRGLYFARLVTPRAVHTTRLLLR